MASAVLFFCLHGHAEKSAVELFYEGNVAYGNEDYAAAEAAYRAATELSPSAGTYFNLGNSLARQDRWAEAAIHYMRAHALDPRQDGPTVGLILSANRLSKESPFPALAEPAALLPQSTWLILTVSGFWLAVIGFLQRVVLRKPLPFGRTLGFIGLLVFANGALATYQFSNYNTHAVVLAESAPLRLAPTATSPSTYAASHGELLRVLDSNGSFVRVRAAGAAEGFITLDEAGIVGR